MSFVLNVVLLTNFSVRPEPCLIINPSTYTFFFFFLYLFLPFSILQQVIHQNYYHSDSDKYRMVEKVATLQRKLLKHMADLESNPEGVDLIFQPQFRKGCEYEEEEERLAALNKIAPATEAVFQQAETDWSVEAVVDEDQL